MDPTIVVSSGITGMVALLSAYMQYQVGMKQAEQKGEAAPAKPDEQTLQDGEKALVVVQEAIAKHGNEDDQADLANFERNPVRYQKQLEQVLLDIAAREQSFAEKLTSGINITNSNVKGVVASKIEGGTINQTFKE